MIKRAGGSTPSRRFMTVVKENITKKRPLKGLTGVLSKTGGRDSAGHVSMRHIGGRSKRKYRVIDFRRDKFDIPGRVVSIEYDPNRTSLIAQINYRDGERRYILAPLGLEVGAEVMSGEKADIKAGNSLSLKSMPIGTVVHNIELNPGRGGALSRSAGSSAMLQAKEGNFAHIKLPSGEIRKVSLTCRATVGTLSNPDWKNITFGKAGRKRHMGIRPTVRGVAQNPSSHPHGGGEGRSGIGMKSPKTPWGKPTLGKKTRSKKRSNRMIVTERKR